MKTAYIGKIQLSDVDLSFLHEAQKLSDVTYILEITPRFRRGPGFSVDRLSGRMGLFRATDIYPEFAKYSGFIDTERFYVLNTPGKLWQLKAFWTNLLLLFFLLRKGFDVIHVAWPLNVYEFVLYLLRKRMILTVHDPFPHTGLDTFIVRLRRKMAFALVPKLILLNKAQTRQFVDFYRIDPGRIVESRLSCYTYLNTLTPDTGKVDTSHRYILFAGKISRYKGLDYLLPAMVKVHERCPDVRLVVAGGGKYHFDISQYQLKDYIDIRNRFIPDTELVALIDNSQFVVCPYTDATQSGVVMSAFAYNKPVLVTNVGGLPEMVGQGRYGRIVKEKDTDALAAAIVDLLNDQSAIDRYRRNIISDYCSGDMSWASIARELNSEYVKIANRK